MATKWKSKTFFSQFDIDDREGCAKAIKNGGWAAMFSAAVSSLLAIAGFFTSSTDQTLAQLLNPMMLVYVALIVVLGFFVFRKSRVAATLLFIYFLVGKALMWYQMGVPTGWLMTLVFFMFYLTAMRATYIWHESYRDAVKKPGQEPQGE